MSDWRISKRRAECGACRRAFAEGEHHFSCIELRASELAREDRCAACFAARGAPADSVWWRTRRSEAGPGLRLDLESLEALFLALEQRTEQAFGELRYLLCLILMRKRRLRLVRGERGPAGEILLVRRPRSGEEQRVAVYELAPARQAELALELARIFEGAELSEALAAAAGPGAPGAPEAPPSGPAV